MILLSRKTFVGSFLVAYWWYTPRQWWDSFPFTFVGSWAHFNKWISCKIFWLITYKISERWRFQFPIRVGRYLFIWTRLNLTTDLHIAAPSREFIDISAIGLEQIRVCKNSTIRTSIPHWRYWSCYVERRPAIRE